MMCMNTVLTFCVGSAVVGLAGASSAQTAHDGLWPLQSFESSSIKTPFLNVTKNGKSELGYLFFSPMDMVRGTGYPAIYQDDGELVWQGPEGDNFAFQVQMLNGEPVLTYFQGLLNPVVGFGIGSISILNSSYHEIHHVTLPGELNFKTIYDPKPFQSYMNIQEDFITDQGSIVVTATNVTQADLRPVGGPEDGWVLDELFYEIDIESNDILFQWSALDHLAELPFSDSRRGLAGAGRSEKDPWHYMSLNSVAKYGDSYLMSSHFMCGAYFISSKGTVLWHLDGTTGGDFHLEPDASFCYQHDIRFQSRSTGKATISMHNNENTGSVGQTSITTGLVLDIDFHTKNVSLNRQMWNQQQPVFSTSQGSFQSLDNGHVLLGQGSTPLIEEYDENGALVMSAQFGYGNFTMESYRAYRYPWVGRPATTPSVRACRRDGGDDDPAKGGKVAVYVSWNGATDIQAWKILAGPDPDKLSVVNTVRRNGYETTVWIQDVGDHVIAEAIGGPNGGVKSNVVTAEACV